MRSDYDDSPLKKLTRRTKTLANGCWKWTGGQSGVWTGTRDVKANRLAWELYVGDIPPGMAVFSKCATPGCINPYHAELRNGTTSQSVVSATGRKRRRAKDENLGDVHPKG